MLVAAGMDAQQLEGKLVEDVAKAFAAYMAEEDPVKSSKHIRYGGRQRRSSTASEGNRWLEVRIPSRLQDMTCMACGRQRVVCLAGGAVQGPATRAEASKPGQGTSALYVSTPPGLHKRAAG